MCDIYADNHCLPFADDSETSRRERLVDSAKLQIELESHIRQVLRIAVKGIFCKFSANDAYGVNALSDVTHQLHPVVDCGVCSRQDDKHEQGFL